MDIKQNYYKIIKSSLSPRSIKDDLVKQLSPRNNRTDNRLSLKLLNLKINDKNDINNNNLTSFSLFPKLSQINLSPNITIMKTKLNNIKKKNSIKSKNKPKRDLLTFDPCLKMLNDNLELNPYNQKLIEDRLKKKKELYFDYDKNNDEFKYNSFSGNNANLLKCKVLFVKGVYDYIYPRLVVKRMKFLEEQYRKDIKENVKKLNDEFNKNKIFIKRFRTREEKIKMSKYLLNGAYSNEAIKSKGNLIKLKKILLNRQLLTKLTKCYDYKD